MTEIGLTITPCSLTFEAAMEELRHELYAIVALLAFLGHDRYLLEPRAIAEGSILQSSYFQSKGWLAG